MSNGLMVTALAQDQVPDVARVGMDGWVPGRGSGSVCSGLAGLCVPLVQLGVCCLWIEGRWLGFITLHLAVFQMKCSGASTTDDIHIHTF